MDSVIIVTRSLNDDLSELSDRFLKTLPFEHLHIRDTSADGYFYELNNIQADWIINVDEDAFCFEPAEILELINFMKRERYHFCGMPDGGLLPIRFHNPVVPNAFFNVFHMKEIREKFDLEAVRSSAWDPSLQAHTPTGLTEPSLYDEFEPYYRFFFWLLKNGFRPLYLNASTWSGDGIATLLHSHRNRPFLIHAWYAREFHTNPQRFVEIANYAISQFQNLPGSS